jgi:hypothetical protein
MVSTFDMATYRVTQGVAAVPEKFGAWVNGTAGQSSDSGRGVVVWIKIRPAGENFAVELSVQ